MLKLLNAVNSKNNNCFVLNPSTLALPLDQQLEEDTIFTLLTTSHQTLIPTQSLDGPTAHQLVTVLEPPLPCRSWQVVTVNFRPEEVFYETT